MRRRVAAAVAAAGIVGAAVRWSTTTQIDDSWALFIVNVIGCGVIGWATARHERARHRRPARPRIGGASPPDAGPSPVLTAGFCGALTSMSALALQLARYLDEGRVATAGAWLALTIAACTTAFVACRITVIAQRGRP